MSVPRLFVPDIDPHASRVRLPSTEAHHVTHVLRLGSGADVRVFNGRGHEWAARLVPSAAKGAVDVELGAEVPATPEPTLQVTLAAGILKGDHMDAVVRDATMMGAARIVPLVTAHVTVTRKAWQGDAAMERWRRVSVASAKQCGRAVVPEVTAPTDFDALVSAHGSQSMVMFVEPAFGADVISPARIERPAGGVLVLTGPEGGWSPEEVGLARAAGATLVHLGPRTIRADAMATAALSALWTIWG